MWSLAMLIVGFVILIAGVVYAAMVFGWAVLWIVTLTASLAALCAVVGVMTRTRDDNAEAP